MLVHPEDQGRDKTKSIQQTGYFFSQQLRNKLLFLYTHLSTSSREMISPFFKALMANSSLVFLYSAKITWSENVGKKAINSQNCYLLLGKIITGEQILSQHLSDYGISA